MGSGESEHRVPLLLVPVGFEALKLDDDNTSVDVKPSAEVDM
jgi:hypothetical protein